YATFPLTMLEGLKPPKRQRERKEKSRSLTRAWIAWEGSRSTAMRLTMKSNEQLDRQRTDTTRTKQVSCKAAPLQASLKPIWLPTMMLWHSRQIKLLRTGDSIEKLVSARTPMTLLSRRSKA